MVQLKVMRAGKNRFGNLEEGRKITAHTCFLAYQIWEVWQHPMWNAELSEKQFGFSQDHFLNLKKKNSKYSLSLLFYQWRILWQLEFDHSIKWDFIKSQSSFFYLCKVDVYVRVSVWCAFGFESNWQWLHEPLVQGTDSGLEVSLL